MGSVSELVDTLMHVLFQPQPGRMRVSLQPVGFFFNEHSRQGASVCLCSCDVCVRKRRVNNGIVER